MPKNLSSPSIFNKKKKTLSLKKGKENKKEKINTDDIKKEIFKLLFINFGIKKVNCLFLMLCSTLVFNESVSQLSSPILNIIKYVNKQKKFITEENFIIMLLMNKVTHFENKRKNITDLLRDNSIPIMLLNNYTKENGQEYLIKTLSGPMEKVLPMVFKCEIDPLKIENQVINQLKEKKKEEKEDNNYVNENIKTVEKSNNNKNKNEISVGNKDIESEKEEEDNINKEEVKNQTKIILKENTQNIQKACTILLKAITTSKSSMPEGFKSICQSLAYAIQRIYEEDNFFFSPNMLYVLDEEIYIDNNDDNNSMTSDYTKTENTAINDSENDKSDDENSKKKKEKIKIKKKKRNIFNLSINTKQTKNSLQNITNENNNEEISHFSEMNLFNSKTATSMTFTKVKVHKSFYDIDENIDNLSIDSTSSSDDENSSSTLSCSSIKLFIPTFEKTIGNNYLAPDEDITSSLDNLEINEESYHADEESSIQSLIIGTLLFLRFFIPAITSPDIYNIVPNKLSMDYRRGLILCGKVLTAMCNDVEFGGKEQYMTCFNSFLHEKKFDLQEFIAWTILPSKNDKDDEKKENIPQNSLQLKNQTTNSIFNSNNLFLGKINKGKKIL
ncbi:Rho GTPase activation protein [Neocallimastix lanati (nom. inval.)]|uniref:Rho GTPase activation protein n=1 Tax=Neocallimastix californiae TaxID=1754190 RepID=A0A1Y2BEJ8_9FUNG|nr:Rho GTPase activation protein [Neocallimastix sp. JGI-2020a]ORY32960.1 Rho GTPase activation protein [Neocallimastix californiae]|eukprot:ORY32960.1 Rho GTPase activation protein [Neocallimastix californiae]